MIEGWGAGAGGGCSDRRVFRRCQTTAGQAGGSSLVSSDAQGTLITIPGGGAGQGAGNILYISGGNSGAAGNSGGAAGSCGSAGFIPGGGGGGTCSGDDDRDDCDGANGVGALYARGTFTVSPGETLTTAVGSGGAGATCRRGSGGSGADGRVLIWY
jgi:hypothetical protein